MVLVNSKGEKFMVNGQREKHYWAKEKILDKQITCLGMPPTD